MPQQLHSECSLDAFFSDLFCPMVLRSRSLNTHRLYKTTINHFRKFKGDEPTLADLNDLTVNRYLKWFRDLPRSPASVNKERANVLAIWRFACRKGYVTIWPDVPMEREPERIPQAWSKSQLETLLRCCKHETGEIAGINAADWWTALHLVCWDTGERIGAVVGLLWDNVDLEKMSLLVRAETRKGGKRDRLYVISSDTKVALKKIYRPNAELVFPWPYVRNYIWNRYEKILAKAGLPTDRKSKFHRMRRSVASHAEAAGGNATELLDHSRRSVTVAYLDPRIVRKAQAVDVLFRLQK